jgi:hypothetical protein
VPPPHDVADVPHDFMRSPSGLRNNQLRPVSCFFPERSFDLAYALLVAELYAWLVKLIVTILWPDNLMAAYVRRLSIALWMALNS